MESRLGRALQEGGVEGPPSRMEWLGHLNHQDLG